MTPVLPDNMYSIMEIAHAERLNIERIQQTAKRTHEILWNTCKAQGFPSFKAFAAHYNNLSNSLITDRTYNHFYYHSKLEPIAHLIKLVVKDRVTTGGNKHEACEFGILKSQYHYYRKHGKPPDVFNRGREKSNYTPAAQNPRTKVDMPKSAEWERFKTGINYANSGSTTKLTIPHVLSMAMVEYMNARPDIFDKAEIQVAPDTEIRVKDNDTLHIQVSPETTKKLSALLARYNSVNILPVTQSQLVEKAIIQMIERVPTEFTDPELAAELKEIEHERNQL